MLVVLHTSIDGIDLFDSVWPVRDPCSYRLDDRCPYGKILHCIFALNRMALTLSSIRTTALQAIA